MPRSEQFEPPAGWNRKTSRIPAKPTEKDDYFERSKREYEEAKRLEEEEYQRGERVRGCYR